MTPLAHAGHWLVDLVYLVPMAIVAVVLARGWLRERRERRTAGPGRGRS